MKWGTGGERFFKHLSKAAIEPFNRVELWISDPKTVGSTPAGRTYLRTLRALRLAS